MFKKSEFSLYNKGRGNNRKMGGVKASFLRSPGTWNRQKGLGKHHTDSEGG